MRRAAAMLIWTVILLGLAGVALYVGLLVERRVNPPVVAIGSGNQLAGYSTGDAVLLRSVAAHEVRATDIVAARTGDGTVVGRVQAVEQDGSRTSFRLVDARPGGPVVIPLSDLVGRADRLVPGIGWVLLAAGHLVARILAGLVLAGLVVVLVTGRRSPLALLDPPDAPLPPGPQPLALPAGAPGPTMTPVRAMAYVEHPMSITPDDLRQVRFAQQRKGGYDTEAVDRALDTVADSVEAMYQERQQLIERLRSLENEVERYKAMESQLGETLAIAERGAQQVKADAQAEAQRILQQAQAGGAASTDGTMVELLGETRAIRSLLQAVLAQGGGLPGRPAAPPQ